MDAHGGPPLHLKVFVSSPGDLGVEREKVLAVLAALPREPWAAGKVTVQPVMWDDPLARSPMEAAVTPQISVNCYKGRPSECDLTILMLWGRIGSVPALFRRDGSRFESGSVWEYEDARDASCKVWLYRRTPPPPIDVDDPQAGEKRGQREAVKRFFDGFRSSDGVMQGGYSECASADDLAGLLHQHLQAFVRDLLDKQQAEPVGSDTPPYLIPEPSRDHDIVGRDLLLEKLWRDVLQGADCSLVFLAGVGKTAVALELVRQKTRILQSFDGVLWADLGKRPEMAQQLRRWAEALRVAPELMTNLATIEDWKKVVKHAIGERHLLIVLDDVWSVKDAREFSGLGARCVSIVTTRLRKVAASLSRQEQVKEVEELDDASGLQLLSNIAPRAVAADAASARELVDAVQGLPLALVLVGKYLNRESGDNDPDRISEAFATLRHAGERLKLRLDQDEEGGDERTLEEIIDVSYGALHTDAARQALEALSVFRPKPQVFSKAMAREICGAAPAAIFELSDMGLVEHAGGGDYSMHRVIAEYARKKLPGTRYLGLNRMALDWYANLLEEDIDHDHAAYLGWYRYEQPDWQATKDAWLFHLAASGDAVGAVLAFLRVYLDAFWWWGYYQRFPFCERLLREWSQRDLGTRQREGLRQLGLFQEYYPAGYDKRGREQDWRKVERCLVSLRQGLGLDGDAGRIEGEDARRVRSFTDFFLAECAGYGRGERDPAFRLYAVAHDQFQQDGSAWEAAWVWFYAGQYCLDSDDHAAAMDYVLRSMREAGETAPLRERDPELLANNYRLMGDLHLAAGDTTVAVREYRRALFYAFIFQAIPEPADTYTVAFYREITGRMVANALALYAVDRRRGRALLEALRAYWTPWWDAYPDTGGSLDDALAVEDAAALATCVFPSPPEADELIKTAGDFAAKVERLIGPLSEAAAISVEQSLALGGTFSANS